MVPADDEHESANEAEKNTSTQKNFAEKLKFWKRCKQEDDEPVRLTPMPPCLMKWWTPLLVAAIFFARVSSSRSSGEANLIGHHPKR